MSILNPFPPRGDPDPVDVFFFFWIPFLCVTVPFIGGFILWILSLFHIVL